MGPVFIGTSILTLPRSIRRAATRSSIFTAKGSRSTRKMAIGRLCKFFFFWFSVLIIFFRYPDRDSASFTVKEIYFLFNDMGVLKYLEGIDAGDESSLLGKERI
jgi:hypothetical protein